MKTPLISIFKLHEAARIPYQATPNAIGVDLYALLRSPDTDRATKKMIPPQMTVMIPTGIVAVANQPYSMFVCSRSGLASQKSLFVTNSPGIIDPDYRGEIKVLLHNGGHEVQWVEDGDRIAQIVLVECPIPILQATTFDLRTLKSTRGEAGFGSTGDK